MATAEIKFDKKANCSFTYDVPSYLEVKSGDVVVVRCAGYTPEGGGDLGLGYVVSVNDGLGASRAVRATPIVDVVDVARHEAELLNRAKAEHLKNALGRRYNDRRMIKEYWDMASDDPTMRRMLEQLDEIGA